MKYVNQLIYPDLPYPTHVKEPDCDPERRKTTVKSSGCGLCAVCMAIDLLTDATLTIEECVRISMECGANHRTGTDMNIFGPVIAEKFDLDYSTTNELDQAILHVRNGGAVIALVAVPDGAQVGLFTKKSHYILLLACDEKYFTILDPSYSEDKFKIPERVGKVNENKAPYLYCDVNTVHSETITNGTKYYMFKRTV